MDAKIAKMAWHLLPLGCSVVACSQIFSVNEDQCSTDADCRARARTLICRDGLCVKDDRPLDQRWACLAQPAAPTKGDFVVSILVHDALTLGPVEGATVSVCVSRFASCELTVSEAVTGADGKTNVSYPLGEPFFVRARKEGYLTTDLYSVWWDLDRCPGVTKEIAITPPAGLEMGAALLGETQRLDAGILLGLVDFCDGSSASGVRFETDPAGDSPYYLIDGIPNRDARATNPGDGVALFLNRPPGVFQLVAVDAASGRELMGPISVVVHAGLATMVLFRPATACPAE